MSALAEAIFYPILPPNILCAKKRKIQRTKEKVQRTSYTTLRQTYIEKASFWVLRWILSTKLKLYQHFSYSLSILFLFLLFPRFTLVSMNEWKELHVMFAAHLRASWECFERVPNRRMWCGFALDPMFADFRGHRTHARQRIAMLPINLQDESANCQLMNKRTKKYRLKKSISIGLRTCLINSVSSLLRPRKTPANSVLNSFPLKSKYRNLVKFIKICPRPNCLRLLFDKSKCNSWSSVGSCSCKSLRTLSFSKSVSVSNGMPRGTFASFLFEQLTVFSRSPSCVICLMRNIIKNMITNTHKQTEQIYHF